MKKTKCMGTSKNKRAMSGGRGKIGKYTQKFNRSYNRFVEIEDKGDVDSRFKKMDEWGRMRNIYNFLKIQNDKYKGSAGTETTAWEKMKEKMKDNNHYKSTISCFEQSDNHILLEVDKCIPEEDYMKGDTEAPDASDDAVIDEASASVVSGANAEVTPVVDTENTTDVSDTGAADVSGETEDNTENAEADTVGQSEAEADTVGQSEVSDDTEAPAPVAEAPVAEVSDDNEAPAPVAEVSDDASVVQSEDDAEAPVAEAAPEAAADVPSAIDVPADAKEQGGGRSKRRQKSSRRRGKSMKSKKGRKTRRKHRAGRH